ncbi:putative ribonuclease H-like domain-containing protein [Tanacetum coccineum]
MWNNVANIPSFVPKAASVPTGSRNRPTSVPASRPFFAGWKNNENPHKNRDLGIVDSGCSRCMTGNKEKLDDFVKIVGGTVTFGGGDGKITGKGTIRTSKLNFENVYYVEELQNFNLWFSEFQEGTISTVSACLTSNLKEMSPSLEESTKWHRRMAHVNFKNMNKLAKHGLVKGLPSKLFTNEHNCIACNKGKQHKASYKAITAVSLISAPLQLLHMDLFGPTSIRSIDHKYYSLVVTDDFRRVAVKERIKTFIEAARYYACCLSYPTMFWTDGSFSGKVPNISHLKPFGCLVTILNTSDHLGKFEGKAEEGFIVGYAAHSKAYRVYNLSSKKIEETLNLRYLEDKPNIQGLGHEWYFDLDYLTNSLGYTRFKANQPAGSQDTNIHAGTQADSDSECDEQVIVVPSFPSNSFSGTKVNEASDMVESSSDYAEELARLQKQAYEANTTAEKHLSQADLATSRNRVPAGRVDSAAGVTDGPTDPSTPVFQPVHTAAQSLPPGHSLGSSEHSSRYPSPSDLANSMSSFSEMEDIHHHSDTGIFSSSSYDDDFGGTVTNLAPSVVVDSVPTKRVNTIHPQSQILGVLFHCSVKKRILMYGACPSTRWKIALGRNNGIMKRTKDIPKDIVVGIKPVARIEAIRLFLAFASYMGFMVYQMDVNSAFLYGEIEEVYVTQPKGFEDPHFPISIFTELLKDLYGLSSSTKSLVLMKGEFEMSAMGELTFFLGLQVKQKPDGIFISQDKYVQDMLKKFDMESVRPATTPFEASKPKSKDEPDDAVNVHLYRSMIGSLMYLTASRPDIQFAVSACSRHQVTPLTSNLNAVKKIFKYLKGQPKLGLWYPRDSPFVLEAYSDSDYAGSHGDRKSTTGGCQFLGRRLISWQCKKQTIVATSSTEAEYVAAANCCGQVLKIHTDDNVADLLTKAFDGPRMWPYTDDKVLILGWLSVFSGVARVPTGSVTGSYWYALTHDPIIYDSLVKQFWSTASLRASKEGPPAILATIDRTPYTITESLVRSQLQLDDEGGVEDLPIADIYLGMDNLGYPSEGKLTFFKNKFSPQWRFLVHTIMHCLSTKTGSWDQFGSQLAIAIICLTEGRRLLPLPLSSRPHESALGPIHFSNVKMKHGRMCIIKELFELNATQAAVQGVVVGKLVKKNEVAEQDVDPLYTWPRQLLPLLSLLQPFLLFVVVLMFPAGATTGPSVLILSKKDNSLCWKGVPQVKERTFRQREEDRLGKEAAKRMYKEEQDELEQEREEMQRKR